jgi:hypothetical protein
VFEALGLGVDFVPLHTEDFGQHAFDQVMPERGAIGGLFAAGGQADDAVRLHFHKAVAFEAFESHGYGGGGNGEPVGERGGDDVVAFGFGFEDGFEVVLFGDGDGFGHRVLG